MTSQYQKTQLVKNYHSVTSCKKKIPTTVYIQ